MDDLISKKFYENYHMSFHNQFSFWYESCWCENIFLDFHFSSKEKYLHIDKKLVTLSVKIYCKSYMGKFLHKIKSIVLRCEKIINNHCWGYQWIMKSNYFTRSNLIIVELKLTLQYNSLDKLNQIYISNYYLHILSYFLDPLKIQPKNMNIWSW